LKVLILGAGGHAQVVADILNAQERAGEPISFAGYLDDRFDERRAGVGDAVVGTFADWRKTPHDAVIVAIGDNAARRAHFDRAASRGTEFAIAKHPAATIAPDVRIGPGSMVCAGVVVNTRVVVGSNTILNTAASVDHHCRIGDHAHIAPGARLGGDVTIGEGALVGIGAIVLPGKTIGAWAIVGAGAVVLDDVAPRATVVGVPATRVTVSTR
jgi:sugar O-acyltransferase (sialic acid O-acetyltransferase NeuD family)